MQPMRDATVDCGLRFIF